MICHSHEEIDKLYADKKSLADKLYACFNYLPRTENIYQGDFIGYGGEDLYQPNTLGYLFPDVITHKIIIAPHTEYIPTGDTLLETHALPLDTKLRSTCEGVLFMQCDCVGRFQDSEG